MQSHSSHSFYLSPVSHSRPRHKPATPGPTIKPTRPASTGHMDFSPKNQAHLHPALNPSSRRHKTSPRALNHSSGRVPNSSPICRSKLPKLATTPTRTHTLGALTHPTKAHSASPLLNTCPTPFNMHSSAPLFTLRFPSTLNRRLASLTPAPRMHYSADLSNAGPRAEQWKPGGSRANRKVLSFIKRPNPDSPLPAFLPLKTQASVQNVSWRFGF